MKLLCIGDSITARVQDGVSYRSALGALDPSISFAGWYLDSNQQRHQGKSGSRICDVESFRWCLLPDYQEIDAILLVIGINDFKIGSIPEAMSLEWLALFRNLRTDFPGKLIYAGTLYDPDWTAQPWVNLVPRHLYAFNRFLFSTQATHFDVLRIVHLQPIVGIEHLADRVHPNPAGMNAIAQAFYAALLPELQARQAAQVGTGA